MVLSPEGFECADGHQGRDMLRTDALQDDCDAPRLQVDDDLLQCMGPACVHHANAPEPQHDHPNICNSHQLVEESLRCAKEQRAIEAVDSNMLVEQFAFRCSR